MKFMSAPQHKRPFEFSLNQQPDLIIFDFNLSEIENGVDLALSIRRTTNMGNPVIINYV